MTLSKPIEGVPISADKQAEVELYRAHAVGLVEKVKALPDGVLSSVLSFVHAKIKALEDTRLEIAEPLTKAKANLDKHFRELRAPYEEAKALIKERLEAQEAERKRLAALEHGRALLVAKSGVEEGDPVFVPVAVPEKAEGVTFRYEWDWELEDLSKVPASFLAVNAHSVKMHLSQFKNSEVATPVPGLRFTKVPRAVAK
jgi:hypothetical protein